MLVRYINIFLRLFTLATRFAFIAAIAYMLPSEDVADYGYIVAISGYFAYVVGLEFYTFANREIITSSEESRRTIVFNQLSLYLGLHVFLIPVLALLLICSGFDISLAIIICVISFLDHFCLESNRILISIGRVNSATIILFIRGALWSIIAIVIMYSFPEYQTLETVSYTWAGFLIVANIFSLLEVFRLKGKLRLEPRWIKNGIISCMVLFIASLSSRGVYIFDRFFIESASNKSILAAYTIYITISNSIIAAVDAAIVSFLFPMVVKTAHYNDKLSFDAVMKRFKYGCWSISLFSGFILILFIGDIISILGKSEYYDSLYMFKWIVFSSIISVFSLPYHVGLYALNKDRVIMWSSIFSFGVFVVLSYCSISFLNSVDYIIYAVVLSTIAMFLTKWFSFKFYYLNEFCESKL